MEYILYIQQVSPVLMVESGGSRNAAQGKLGVVLAGFQYKADWEGHTVGVGSRGIGVRQVGGYRC